MVFLLMLLVPFRDLTQLVDLIIKVKEGPFDLLLQLLLLPKVR